MPAVGLSDDEIELIGQRVAALNDYPSASVGDILNMAFDRRQVSVDENLAAKKNPRTRDRTFFPMI